MPAHETVSSGNGGTIWLNKNEFSIFLNETSSLSYRLEIQEVAFEQTFPKNIPPPPSPFSSTLPPPPPRGGREIAGTPDLARIGVVPPPHICGGLRNTPILARSGVRPSE